jgi:histidine phosphotransferase ChpT
MGDEMSDETIEFASLLCSRLCHDLLSPVGSFGNGIELIRDEGDAEMQARYVDLLESSANAAINRLKFFRLAFGSSGGYGETLAVGDLVEAVRGLVAETRKTEIVWVGSDGPVDKRAARALLALSMTVVDALVRGGRIDMAVERRGDTLELALRGAGDRVVIDEASEAAFASDVPPTPKTIPVALARRIARQAGGDIMLSRPSPTELVVGAMLKTAS